MDLSIIIVNYNVKEFLQNLLHSIEKAARNISVEIIVVDNASEDGSAELIKEKFQHVTLVANKENLGFGKANNIGLSTAKGKYILMINPDTIVQEDTLEKMIGFFEQTPNAGMAGCKILNPDGSLQLACRRSFPGPWTSFCKVTGLSTLFPTSPIFARYNLTYLDENQTHEVDAVSGSFMMMPKSVYEKIGGFDEQFFMYGEDLDLCYRVQQAGYKVYYVHSTQIIHYKGESTRRSSFDDTKIFYDAMHLFVKKHLSSSFLIGAILRGAIAVRKFVAFLGRGKLIILSILLDFIFFNLSLLLAEKIYESVRVWKGFPDFSLPIVYTVPALLHILLGSFFGVYKRDTISVLKNFITIIAGFFVLSSLTFFFKDFAYSRAVVIITYLLLFFTLSFWRIFLKLFFKLGFADTNRMIPKTLIVGINKSAVEIATKLKSRNISLHSVIGFIGFSKKDIGRTLNGIEILGDVENIDKVIRDKKINEIIFSSEELSYNQLMSIVSKCQKENVEFKLAGNNLDFLVGKSSVSILDDIPLIEVQYNISRPLNRFFKKLFDFSLASAVLFFIYPFIYFFTKLLKKQSEFTSAVLEVPQVLRSKLSFVGPKNSSYFNGLYIGKIGLTGLWYTERENNQDSERLDIFYAKNQSIWLDLEILGKTVSKMLNERKQNG